MCYSRIVVLKSISRVKDIAQIHGLGSPSELRCIAALYDHILRNSRIVVTGGSKDDIVNRISTHSKDFCIRFIARLGGTVEQHILASTTHCIELKPGSHTLKANEGRVTTHVHLVNIGWLLYSAACLESTNVTNHASITGQHVCQPNLDVKAANRSIPSVDVIVTRILEMLLKVRFAIPVVQRVASMLMLRPVILQIQDQNPTACRQAFCIGKGEAHSKSQPLKLLSVSSTRMCHSVYRAGTSIQFF